MSTVQRAREKKSRGRRIEKNQKRKEKKKKKKRKKKKKKKKEKNGPLWSRRDSAGSASFASDALMVASEAEPVRWGRGWFIEEGETNHIVVPNAKEIGGIETKLEQGKTRS